MMKGYVHVQPSVLAPLTSLVDRIVEYRVGRATSLPEVGDRTPLLSRHSPLPSEGYDVLRGRSPSATNGQYGSIAPKMPDIVEQHTP